MKTIIATLLLAALVLPTHAAPKEYPLHGRVTAIGFIRAKDPLSPSYKTFSITMADGTRFDLEEKGWTNDHRTPANKDEVDFRVDGRAHKEHAWIHWSSGDETKYDIVNVVAASASDAQAENVTETKPRPCRAYFTVLETDEVTVGLPMLGLNKPQLSWYQKNGNKGKFAGICYLDLGRMSVDDFISREKSGAIHGPDVAPNVPIYVIAWGEQLRTAFYMHSYETVEHVNGMDANGNATGANVPVTHTNAGQTNSYVADGVLMRWERDTDKVISLAPLHMRLSKKRIIPYYGAFVPASASQSLLQNGMEAIRQRLDSGTP
jgi:hypothetical protein